MISKIGMNGYKETFWRLRVPDEECSPGLEVGVTTGDRGITIGGSLIAWADIDEARAQLPSQQPKLGLAEGDRPGYDALWLSFGLSRAAFVTLPRVMMHDMPDTWQADMARLLNEWQATWVNQPEISSRVQIVDADGRLMKIPEWILNYRHPDREQLDSMRKKP